MPSPGEKLIFLCIARSYSNRGNAQSVKLSFQKQF